MEGEGGKVYTESRCRAEESLPKAPSAEATFDRGEAGNAFERPEGIARLDTNCSKDAISLTSFLLYPRPASFDLHPARGCPFRQHVRSHHPLLLEALCPSLSSSIIQSCRVPRVRVRLDKPKAVMWTHTAAVETTRSRNFFDLGGAGGKQGSILSPNGGAPVAVAASSSTPPRVLAINRRSLSTATSAPPRATPTTAYIAIGSNVGDRARHISRALQYLDNPASLSAASRPATPQPELEDVRYTASTSKILETSFLYESEPMYVLEQERFLNGVCKVSASLSGNQFAELPVRPPMRAMATTRSDSTFRLSEGSAELCTLQQ